MGTYVQQQVCHLLLLEQLEDARAQAVEVRRQSAQVDGPGVGFQGVEDAGGERGWEVQGNEWGGAEAGAAPGNQRGDGGLRVGNSGVEKDGREKGLEDGM